MDKFIECCRTGNLENLVKIYKSDPNINININNELPFRVACQHGHLNIIRQLYRWSPIIDIGVYKDYTFRNACYHGHLNIINQLYSWRPEIDFSIENYGGFRLACYGNHLNVIRQLYIWHPFIEINNMSIIEWLALLNNGVNIIRVIWSLEPNILNICMKEFSHFSKWYDYKCPNSIKTILEYN
jgi:hypothetical protein